jgi:hypothetical protein
MPSINEHLFIIMSCKPLGRVRSREIGASSVEGDLMRNGRTIVHLVEMTSSIFYFMEKILK